jgi:predicted SAM-dependent methyltransferase
MENNSQISYLNLGCGIHFHPDWINVDFDKTGKDVIVTNLLDKIPFENDFAQVIYHSHLLEHFTKADAQKFIGDCYRVLKSNGIIRVVVPDMEAIAEQYLKNLKDSLGNDQNAQESYDWIVLELFDQMARNQSGGQMLAYLADSPIRNKQYIIGRVGEEAADIINAITVKGYKASENLFNRLRKSILNQRIKLAKMLLAGNGKWIDVGRFRLSGEIHQWMYDRYSLHKLLTECGFRNIQKTNAFQSLIPNWEKYNLDAVGGKVRKPDSLFFEAMK